jgi:2-phosphoglycolate phosphatase
MAENNIKLILFDLDGTLVDSRADIVAAANVTRERLDMPPISPETVASYIGEGIRDLVSRVLGEPAPAPEQLEKALKIFREYYTAHCLDKTVLYPGVAETLDVLRSRGKAMSVATNKTTEISRKILRGLRIEKYFYIVLGGDSRYKKKPDPETLLAIMDQLKVPPERTAMVGDSAGDIEAGKAAKVAITCGMTYGIGKPAAVKAATPDNVLDKFEQLVEVFCRGERRSGVR